MTSLTETVCPFCTLLCENVYTDEERNFACTTAQKSMAILPTVNMYTDNKAVTRDEALQEASQLLHKAQSILYTGLSVDVAGMRSVLNLARTTGGVVDHQYSDEFAPYIDALQHTGGFNTTLTETVNRAECLLLIGEELEKNYPHLLNQCVKHQRLFPENISPPSLLRLANTEESLNTLPELLAVMNALLLGDEVTDTLSCSGVSIAQLKAIIQQLQQAKYSVIIWDNAELPNEHASVIIQSLYCFIDKMNTTHRCAALPLGGRHQSSTFMQVMTWQTAYPMRVCFQQGAAHYDIHQYSSQRSLASDEIDLVVWIASSTNMSYPDTPHPVIAFAPELPEHLPNPPAVFIPIGVVGVDHAGYLFRFDQVVTLAVQQIRDCGLPNIATLLPQLLQYYKEAIQQDDTENFNNQG